MKIKYNLLSAKTTVYGAVKIARNKVTDFSEGSLNIQNLRHNKISNHIFEIPPKNQKELNEKGRTVFTVIERTIVDIERTTLE